MRVDKKLLIQKLEEVKSQCFKNELSKKQKGCFNYRLTFRRAEKRCRPLLKAQLHFLRHPEQKPYFFFPRS